MQSLKDPISKFQISFQLVMNRTNEGKRDFGSFHSSNVQELLDIPDVSFPQWYFEKDKLPENICFKS